MEIPGGCVEEVSAVVGTALSSRARIWSSVPPSAARLSAGTVPALPYPVMVPFSPCRKTGPTHLRLPPSKLLLSTSTIYAHCSKSLSSASAVPCTMFSAAWLCRSLTAPSASRLNAASPFSSVMDFPLWELGSRGHPRTGQYCPCLKQQLDLEL